MEVPLSRAERRALPRSPSDVSEAGLIIPLFTDEGTGAQIQ